MNPREYARCDAVELASLVKRGEVSAIELTAAALQAIEATNPTVNAVVELYEDRIEDLNEHNVGGGPLRGVPFLVKDDKGHEKGRTIEYGSRLCKGMTAKFDSNLFKLLRKAGVNVIGRTNVPEYCIAGSTENLLYGNTSTPWKAGYSSGGSSGGAAAAVAAGMVPLAHGSDIAGSLRIPASWSGVIGLKPSRGLLSAGPRVDENGMGLSMNFVQSKSVRDTALMLDCLSVPQPGDPFVVSRPEQPYSNYCRPPERLKIGWTAKPLSDFPVDPEIAESVKNVARLLQDSGHHVEEANLDFDHETASREMVHFWFFGFSLKLDAFAKETGRSIGRQTLEPVVLGIYELSKSIDAAKFLHSLEFLNAARRKIGRYFTKHDVMLSPATAIPSPPHGKYGLNFEDFDPVEYLVYADRPIQFCFPFNVAGAPAISLPVGMHSSGLPFGVQLGAKPSQDHILIGLAHELELALGWNSNIPPIHASRESSVGAPN